MGGGGRSNDCILHFSEAISLMLDGPGLLLKKPFENESRKQAVNVRKTLAGVHNSSKAIAVVLHFMLGFCCVEHRVAFVVLYLKQVDVRQRFSKYMMSSGVNDSFTLLNGTQYAVKPAVELDCW